MKSVPRSFLEFIKWDIRGVIATLAALAVLVGLGWAASTNALYTFDFGTASFDDLDSGAVQVKGALSIYPQSYNTLLFGWKTTNVQEFTNKSVSNKLNRDYNGGSSAATNTFVVSGLEPRVYRFRFTSGGATANLSTRIQLGSQAISLTANKSWKTGDIVYETTDGKAEIAFSSADGIRSWGVCALQIFTEEGKAPEPSFELSIIPAEHSVAAGGTAVFNIGLTPLNNYAGGAQLSISGLVSGITAQFVPAVVAALPGDSELQISTASNTVPTNYEFLVRAIGTGGEPVSRTGTVSLTVTQASSTLPTVTPNAPAGGETGPIAELPPRTTAEVKTEFKLVDAFAAAQEKKMLQQKEFLEIGDIGFELGSVPIMPELPQPKTTFEGVLQGLVQSGIIQSAVDVAPPAQPAREGFWTRFIKTLFPPVS